MDLTRKEAMDWMLRNGNQPIRYCRYANDTRRAAQIAWHLAVIFKRRNETPISPASLDCYMHHVRNAHYQVQNAIYCDRNVRPIPARTVSALCPSLYELGLNPDGEVMEHLIQGERIAPTIIWDDVSRSRPRSHRCLRCGRFITYDQAWASLGRCIPCAKARHALTESLAF